MGLLAIVQCMRPHQYVKNLFIFLPLFFALKITDVELLFNAFLAFISFSLLASSIYTLNDYHDIEEDKLHPKKKARPLASGAISKGQAIALMIFLSIVGLSIMSSFSLGAVANVCTYITMNIAYSLYLKHVAIIDVTIIAVGFVLRLFIRIMIPQFSVRL